MNTGKCTCNNTFRIRVAYQKPSAVSLGTDTAYLAGRTIEEAFAFENLGWCQSDKRQLLGLKCPETSLPELLAAIHDRIRSRSFKKTDFALNMLQFDPSEWKTPHYIQEGLVWLAQLLSESRLTLPAESTDDQ